MKKICITVFLFCIGFAAFAQTAPKAVLSNSDLDNFVKNFAEIDKIISEHDDELPYTEGDLTTEYIMETRGFPVSAQLRAKLSNVGFPNNGFEKIIVISIGIGCFSSERMLSAMLEERENPETPPDSGRIAEIAEEIALLRAAVHEKDLELIAARIEDLLRVMGGS